MSFYFAGYFFDKYKQFLERNHKDYYFKVDLKYGKLYFTRKLFSLPGRYLHGRDHSKYMLSLGWLIENEFDYLFGDGDEYEL